MTAQTGICIGGLFHGLVIRAMPNEPAAVLRMPLSRVEYVFMSNEFGNWWIVP